MRRLRASSDDIPRGVATGAMPIDRKISRSQPADETLFTLSDPEHHYSFSEICDLLDQAEALGFSLDGPELRTLHTARDLEILVRRRQ